MYKEEVENQQTQMERHIKLEHQDTMGKAYYRNGEVEIDLKCAAHVGKFSEMINEF